MRNSPILRESRGARPWWTLAVFSLLLWTPGQMASASEAQLVGIGNKCLGVENGANVGAAVVLKPCDADDALQLWQLPPAGFSGQVVGPGGLCLDVANATSDDHTPIQLFGCHGRANQQWRHLDDGRVVGLADKCLDIEGATPIDGTRAILFGCHGQNNQIFQAATHNGWGRSPLMVDRNYSRRLFATQDPQVLYLEYRGALSRSEDGGHSWSFVIADQAWGRVAYSLSLTLVDRSDARRLFATQNLDGRILLRSEDSGRTWIAVHDAGGQSSLAQSPLDPAQYFLASQRGFFRSVDRGASFTRVSDLPTLNPALDLKIAANGDLYLRQHRGCFSHHCGIGGVLSRSTDGGATWESVRSAPNEEAWTNTFVTHPTDAATLYYSYADETGQYLQRSSDRGATWQNLNPPNGAIGLAYVDPRHPDELWQVQGGQIFRSRDRGQTWQTEDFSLYDGAVATSESFTQAGLFVLSRLSQSDSLSLSRFDGQSWTSYGIARLPQFEPYHLASSAQRQRFYASEFAVWRTDDGGRTWSQVQERACPYALEADASQPDVVYLGNSMCEPGAKPVLYRSLDAGETLEPVGPVRSGFTESIQSFEWQGKTASVALSSSYSDGYFVLRSLDHFATWTWVALPGAAKELLVDRRGVLYATDHDFQVHYSLDAGATWATTYHTNARFAAGADFLLQVRNFDDSLSISNDFGQTWASISGPRSWGKIRTAQVDAWGRIFLTDEAARIAVSTDFGRTWQSHHRGLPMIWNSRIVVDPFEPKNWMVGTANGIYGGHFDSPAATGISIPTEIGERFSARITWKDALGQTGHGYGSRLTDDTSVFWLFSPERAEIAVKILDARALNGRFWVFVGAMTNVEFELEILDHLTGERRRYHNPLGTFSSFGDTAAFPLGATATAVRSPRQIEGPPAVGAHQVSVQGHFLIEVTWQDGAGGSGAGQGFPLGVDTAGFYFFDPANIELLVNVIDGRALNGHYWVFFGSLSNVAYRVTLTDTQTGQRRTYENPAGTFASFNDLEAF